MKKSEEWGRGRNEAERGSKRDAGKDGAERKRM